MVRRVDMPVGVNQMAVGGGLGEATVASPIEDPEKQDNTGDAEKTRQEDDCEDAHSHGQHLGSHLFGPFRWLTRHGQNRAHSRSNRRNFTNRIALTMVYTEGRVTRSALYAVGDLRVRVQGTLFLVQRPGSRR
jgi:hypothetical protein